MKQGLSHINRESVDAIRTVVWELEKAGYIRRSQSRDDKGKMAEMVYTIYEQPVLENPTSDNPVSENPMQLNKDIQTKNQKKKDGTITDSIPILSPPSPLEEAAAPPERKRAERSVEILKSTNERNYINTTPTPATSDLLNY